MTDLKDPRSFDIPLFPIKVAAQAASGTAAGTARIWYQRGRIKLNDSDASFGPAGAAPDKPGLPRLLTFRAVLTLSAAAPLIRTGTEVSVAYNAAKQWTYFGDHRSRHRHPAGLFTGPGVLTVLVNYADVGAFVVPALISGDGIHFENPDLFGFGHPVPIPPALVHINKVLDYARGVCEGFLH